MEGDRPLVKAIWNGAVIVESVPRRRLAMQSAKVAVVVSPLLLAVNHYDEFARGEWSALGLKAALTFLVPFLVSFHSAVSALRESQTARSEGGVRLREPAQ